MAMPMLAEARISAPSMTRGLLQLGEDPFGHGDRVVPGADVFHQDGEFVSSSSA